MDKLSLTQRIKQFIAAVAWRVFLWGNETCEERYWDEIYEQEKAFREDEYEVQM